MILGALVLTFFVVTEARSDHRSFDVTLFRNRGYAVSLSAVTLAFFAMSGITFTLPVLPADAARVHHPPGGAVLPAVRRRSDHRGTERSARWSTASATATS